MSDENFAILNQKKIRDPFSVVRLKTQNYLLKSVVLPNLVVVLITYVVECDKLENWQSIILKCLKRLLIKMR